MESRITDQPNIHTIVREVDPTLRAGQERKVTIEKATEQKREQLAPKVERIIIDISKQPTEKKEEYERSETEFEKTESKSVPTGKVPSHPQEILKEGRNILTETQRIKKHLGRRLPGQPLPQKFKNKVYTEPTLEFFNKLVGENTHSVLGRTGFKVSRVCLGTMNFGEIDKEFGERPGQLNENEAHKILDRYVELGGNCIDTANFFPWFGSTSGKSEEIIGNWLKNQKRDKIFLMTKIRMPTNDSSDVNSCGLSRNNIIDSVEECLTRLQTNHIDLLQINGWDTSVSTFDLVKDLDDLVRSGKVRYIGCCDLKAWQLQKLIDYSKLLGAHKPVCYEGEFNLLTRGCELEVAEVCLHERIGFFAYSPLKYGFIEEEFNNKQDAVEGSRIEAASGEQPNLAAMAEPFENIVEDPSYNRLLNTCHKIAQDKNLTASQIALLWCLQQNFVTSVVIGVEDINELEENMAVINNNLELTNEEMMELNEAVNFEYDYPYNSITSYVGHKKFFPTSETSYEQLSLSNLMIESRPRVCPPSRREDEFSQFKCKETQKYNEEPTFGSQEEQEQVLTEQQEQPEEENAPESANPQEMSQEFMKQRNQPLVEESVRREENVGQQRD